MSSISGLLSDPIYISFYENMIPKFYQHTNIRKLLRKLTCLESQISTVQTSNDINRIRIHELKLIQRTLPV